MELQPWWEFDLLKKKMLLIIILCIKIQEKT